MSCTGAEEIWLVYHQVSRTCKPATAQLVDVEFHKYTTMDLEDLLDHVFLHGYVDAKFRPVSWPLSRDCIASRHRGYAICALDELRGHVHTPRAHVATQRIKLDAPHHKFDRLAHVTNYIFAQGYLPANLRSLVYWRGICGKQIDENAKIEDLLSWGEGVSEDKSLRLIIDH
ncbi:hypothetical protein EWM64_g6217 [Hericium alpestre]|uniref:Uncharacterized protein n=1 Tax=Hericium alpestre TaxID=135208 RepID=A0A4Y9ZSD7_9AGAM|nr:hypothetical protein EWM64_g6217 [Hericium alpestre]